VSAKQILTGEVEEMHAESLRDALSMRVASSASESTSAK
jgi:hypothetical protein